MQKLKINYQKENLLIEIGTEEIPANILRKISESFFYNFIAQLKSFRFKYKKIYWFSTHRRLALKIYKLNLYQENILIEKKGPSIEIAYKNGSYTFIAKKWAKKWGINLKKINHLKNNSGEWLFYTFQKKGKHITKLLDNIIYNSLLNLSKFKFMKWNEKKIKFIRPIRALTILLGSKLISSKIFSIQSSRMLYGNPFTEIKKIKIQNVNEYPEILYLKGNVLADYEVRKNSILKQSQKLTNKIQGKLKIKESLLEEVTSLVEWPIVLMGKFKKRFLFLPIEALVLTMEKNQKYFPIYNKKDDLMPYFLFVSNIVSDNTSEVIFGNEKVLHARFLDIEYFFNTDSKYALQKYLPRLENVLFQKELGNLKEKTFRIQFLSLWIAKKININSQDNNISRASLLSKCDLMTLMVSEFPETKGLMGMYYAKCFRESKEVFLALKEYYQPNYINKNIPNNLIACILSISDKIDTITGIIGIGKIPNGEKDPFGLRSLTIGVLRILLEKKLKINLNDLINKSFDLYQKYLNINNKSIITNQIWKFFIDRLRQFYKKDLFKLFIFDSLIKSKPKYLLNIDMYIKLASQFYKFKECSELILINKRVLNILSKFDFEKEKPFIIKLSLLEKKEEIELIYFSKKIRKKIFFFLEKNLYLDALFETHKICKYVNNFFNNVHINTKNVLIVQNRLKILYKVKKLLLMIIDFSFFKKP